MPSLIALTATLRTQALARVAGRSQSTLIAWTAPLMVLSALKLRPADWVLPLEEIANLLRTLN